MNNAEYCDECGGEIIGVTCSVCFKRAKTSRHIGYTKIFLQEKICDAKKSNKIDSIFYDKEFVKDVTGIEKLGKTLCTYDKLNYWNYDRIIESDTVKIKVPKSVIDMRCHNSHYIYFDNDLRFKKKKIRITDIYIPGIRFFVDIGFSDNEKDFIIATGFKWWSNKSKKDKKEKIK